MLAASWSSIQSRPGCRPVKMGSCTPKGRRRGILNGGRGRGTCDEEEEEEEKGKKKVKSENGRRGELEEWLELYLRPGTSRLREVDSETRVLMITEAMAKIDHEWFGGLRYLGHSFLKLGIVAYLMG